jgi:HEAT repeat protein
MRSGVWVCVVLLAGCARTGHPPAEEEPVAALAAKLHADDETVRLEGRLGLMGAGGPGIRALLEALRSNDPRVRYDASAALAALGPRLGTEAVPALADAADDPDPLIRTNALTALGRIGPPARTAVPALAKALGDDDLRVRLVAPLALARVQGAEAVPTLLEALRDPRMRCAAAVALEVLGPAAQAAVPALQALAEDGSLAEREAASDALRRIVPPESPPLPQVVAARAVCE